MMDDYVQLITKLLADKEQLTAALEQLESRCNEAEQQCREMAAREELMQSRAD